MFRSLNKILPTIGKRFASTMFQSPNSQPKLTASLFVKPQAPQIQLYKPVEQPSILNQIVEKVDNFDGSKTMYMTSVLRKRRLKMKKHKLRKRRKAQRALRIKIGR